MKFLLDQDVYRLSRFYGEYAIIHARIAAKTNLQICRIDPVSDPVF
ncbi:MAG TPA: hypothetical protein VGA17_13415 [Nitrospiraceae bacterium]